MRERQAIQGGHQRLKLPNGHREIIAEQRGNAVGLGRSHIERRRQPAEPALHCLHLRAVDLLRHQQRASRRIGAEHLIEERRFLAGTQRRVVIQRVDPEVRIASQHFVGAFAGEHHLDARGSHGTAEEVLGDAVAVEHLRFGMPDRIRERIGDLPPSDRNRPVHLLLREPEDGA